MIRFTSTVAGLIAAAALATFRVRAAEPAMAIPVRTDGMIATWYPPADGKRGPAILALGGSEGGEGGSQRLATALAAQGYGVLALAYFGAHGLPKALQEIPLEYFDHALAWLSARPEADPKRIGIYGISVGGETALLVASRHPEIKAVVAAVPSSVVWQGFDPADYRSVKSSYALGGKPVPYVPFDNGAAFTGVHDLYLRSLKTAAAHSDAIIPVERIGGAVLLLSGRDDKLWPSTMMSEQVMVRLDAHGFKPDHEHIAYADAGHGAMTPPDGRQAANTTFDNIGGTPEGNAAARSDMWRRVTAFFAAALRPHKAVR